MKAFLNSGSEIHSLVRLESILDVTREGVAARPWAPFAAGAIWVDPGRLG